MWVNSFDPELEYALFERCGIAAATNLNDADIVCFVGGADVNPILYGEEPLPGTGFDNRRDDSDLAIWRSSKDKMKVGICRGGQFLNVMNGGKLWQDVNYHGRYHFLNDRFTGEKVWVSSTHHQQFRPAASAIVIATARETTYKVAKQINWKLKDNGTAADDFFKIDHEVLWYPESRSLCFQPHPEYDDAKPTGEYFKGVLSKCLSNAYPLDQRGHGIFSEINKERGK